MAFTPARFNLEVGPLSSFPEAGDATERFKSLIELAYKHDQLWVLTSPPKGEKYSGPMKLCNAHVWVNAFQRYTKEELFTEYRAYGISPNWIRRQPGEFAFLTSPIYGEIFGTAWYRIFKVLGDAGMFSFMVRNNTNIARGPGIGVGLFCEGDGVIAQAMIDEIKFDSRLEF